METLALATITASFVVTVAMMIRALVMGSDHLSRASSRRPF